jgi:hypothetical protein
VPPVLPPKTPAVFENREPDWQEVEVLAALFHTLHVDRDGLVAKREYAPPLELI